MPPPAGYAGRGGGAELDRDRAAAPRPTAGPTIVDAIRGGALDAELGGLLWLLLDGGIPLTVAGPGDDASAQVARAAVLTALLDLASPERIPRTLAGPDEDFSWLEAAESLGWRRSGPLDPVPAVPADTLILAGEIGSGPTADTTGDQARVVVRAVARGFALAATARAARLEDLLDELRRRPIRLTDDELTVLGVVAILEPRARRASPDGLVASGLPRLAAVHYLRPLARDVHGHPQRLPPAVLATWDGQIARFEHFAWGVAAELAARVGRRTGDFEREAERRTTVLTALSAVEPDGAPAVDRAALRATLDRARVTPEPVDRTDH